MAKITRKVAKIFGSSAGANQIAKFGSLAAGSPATYSGATADPATIQSLGNWLSGWFAGVEGANSPAIEDLNAFCYTMAYQIAYQMQEGIPEWDSSTTYYTGSIVQDGSANIYYSLVDNNLNNLVSDTSKWGYLPNSFANSRQRPTGTTVGIGGIAISNPIAFVTTSNSYVDVTNATVTITTAGKPVFVGLVGNPAVVTNSGLGMSMVTGDVGPSVNYKILRGSTTVAVYQMSFTGNGSSTSWGMQVPSGALSGLDNVAAGTYTYKVQMLCGTNSRGAIAESLLMAYELS